MNHLFNKLFSDNKNPYPNANMSYRHDYNNPVYGAMPGAIPSPNPSYNGSPVPYYSGSNSYINQQQSAQLVPYHPQQSTSTVSSSTTYDPTHAQQLAHRTQIMGQDVVLLLNGKKITVSQASVSSFCTDYVCRTLAQSSALSCQILDRLSKNNKISIRHRENTTGYVIKHKYATAAPSISLSAGMVAALGDFSQFRDIINDFFSYTYTDAVKNHETYSTHYYANDQYTITGCFLQRKVCRKSNGLKMALVSKKYTDTQYETSCYLFTFKVAQAAKFMENYLYGSQ